MTRYYSTRSAGRMTDGDEGGDFALELEVTEALMNMTPEQWEKALADTERILKRHREQAAMLKRRKT